jgi:hypothetical protein
MVDTLTILLAEFEKSPSDLQVQLILQSLPFFREILESITRSQFTQALQGMSNTFLRFSNRCMNNILRDPSGSEVYPAFLSNFLDSPLVKVSLDSLAQLFAGITSIRGLDTHVLERFQIPFSKFFADQDLCGLFIHKDGFLSSWFTYALEPTNSLLPMVLSQLSLRVTFFTQPVFLNHVSDFLAAVSTNFGSLTVAQSRFIVPVIHSVIREHQDTLLHKFEKSYGFDAIEEFILRHQDEDIELVSLLEVFHDVSLSRTADDHPSINMIVSLLSSSECGIELRHRSLAGLQVLITSLTPETACLAPDHVSMIVAAIPIDDPISVIALSSLCTLLMNHTNFELSSITSLLLRFLTFDTLMVIDLSMLVILFASHPECTQPFVAQIFPALFLDLTADEFASLVNKYSVLPSIFAFHFTASLDHDTLCRALATFVRAYPAITDRQCAQSALQKIILEKRGSAFVPTLFEALDSVLATGDSTLLDLLTSIAQRFSAFRRECLSHEVYTSLFAAPALHNIDHRPVLDFVATLPKRRYIAAVDASVSANLALHSYVGATPDELLTFACGLRQGTAIADGSLCFPSILGRCRDHVFTSPYDLWLCGTSHRSRASRASSSRPRTAAIPVRVCGGLRGPIGDAPAF